MFVLLIAIGVVAVGSCAKLPSYVQRCNPSDPAIDQCLKSTLQNVIQKFAHGAPEVGVKPLEPLDITSLVIGQGSGPVNVEQNFKNIKLHGLTKSKVLSVSSDIKNRKLYTESLSPELRLEAEYELNGRILLLPIQGKGLCNVTLVNAWLNHTLISDSVQRKGKEYWKLRDYKVTIVPERMVFNFENLFNGDKLLGDEINRVLNENWDAIFSDVRGGYDESFGLIFKDIAHRVFTKVPVEDMFVS